MTLTQYIRPPEQQIGRGSFTTGARCWIPLPSGWAIYRLQIQDLVVNATGDTSICLGYSVDGTNPVTTNCRGGLNLGTLGTWDNAPGHRLADSGWNNAGQSASWKVDLYHFPSKLKGLTAVGVYYNYQSGTIEGSWVSGTYKATTQPTHVIVYPGDFGSSTFKTTATIDFTYTLYGVRI